MYDPRICPYLTRIFVHTLCKIRKIHLIFWCEEYMETHSFRRVSGDLPETLWKLCASIKFPRQNITVGEITVFYTVF